MLFALSSFITMFLDTCDAVACATFQKESQRNPDESLTLECVVRRIFREAEVSKQEFPQPTFPQKLNF